MFFFLIYLASNGGIVDHSDGERSFLYAENFVLNGKLAYGLGLPSDDELKKMSVKNRLHNVAKISYEKNVEMLGNITKTEYVKEFKEKNKDEFYNQTYLALPIVAIPFYFMSLYLGFSPINFVPLLLNSSIIAVTAVIIFALGKELFKSERIGFVLSIIFGLTSFIWPHVSSMFPRPLGILFLMLSIYFILHSRKKSGLVLPIFAGISFGMSFISMSFFLLFLPGMIIFGIYQFRKNKKQLAAFVIATIILVGVQGYANIYRFGAIDDFGFPDLPLENRNPLTNPIKHVEGLYGYLISPGRSFFIFFPIALLYPLGLYYLFKKDPSLALLFIYITLITFLFAATTPNWDKLDGRNFGPHRYLIPMIPLIAVSMGALISKFSNSIKAMLTIIGLSIIGFSVNLIGNLSNIRIGWGYGEEIEGIKGGVKHETFAWDPNYSSLSQIYKVITNGYHEKITGCNYDLYIYCEFGIISLVLLGIIISIVGVMILKILKNKTMTKSLI